MMRTGNFYYVDKTMYIPLLEEQANYIFFIRPRRFGKSLWLNMLRAYYDSTCKGRFDELFGDLWIGKNPTEEQGQYQILTLDFSQVGGKSDTLEESFNSYASKCLDAFMDNYFQAYSDDIRKRFHAADKTVDKLTILNLAAKSNGIKLFLIIDEYDNFTNTVLNEEGESVYHAMTHASGFYRDIFKKFKGMFDKIIMTGVSPVTLDDVTSGFNIGWNISTKQQFNQMLGFSEEDVRQMINYYKENGKITDSVSTETIVEDMKPWYDNYCFSERSLESHSHVFNSDMVLYYLSNYIVDKCPPRNMVDPNTRTDYDKLRNLLLLDKLDGDRKGVISEIATKGDILANVEDSFPAKMLVKPNIFTSLLFYYGMLTYKALQRGGQTILGIPNNNVRKQYYDYLIEQFEEIATIDTNKLRLVFANMAMDGDWRGCMQYLSDAYTKVSSARDGIQSERNIQGFFMAYLGQCDYYILTPELEMSHGYCDFFLLPNLTYYHADHSYIIELKFLTPKDWRGKASSQWQEAVEQINHYAEAPRIEALRQGTTLHKVIMQFKGGKLMRMEEI